MAVLACCHQDCRCSCDLNDCLPSPAFGFHFRVSFLLCSSDSSLGTPVTMVFTKIAVLANTMGVNWPIGMRTTIRELLTSTGMVTVLASTLSIKGTIYVGALGDYPFLCSFDCLLRLLLLLWFSNNWLLTRLFCGSTLRGWYLISVSNRVTSNKRPTVFKFLFLHLLALLHADVLMRIWHDGVGFFETAALLRRGASTVIRGSRSSLVLRRFLSRDKHLSQGAHRKGDICILHDQV